MEFFNLLQKLRERYAEDFVQRENGTVLLGPDTVPKSRHMLFAPLSDEIMEAYLVSQYKHRFPGDYRDFLKYSNGAVLFIARLRTKKFCFAHSMFVIFGLPMTAPFDRAPDMEEPFDVRVEDLARHDDIPETWLKCATYTEGRDLDRAIDLFVDTRTSRVYACPKNESDVLEQWDDLDTCFCAVYRRLENEPGEFEYHG